jgi:hypothetical protein
MPFTPAANSENRAEQRSLFIFVHIHQLKKKETPSFIIQYIFLPLEEKECYFMKQAT